MSGSVRRKPGNSRRPPAHRFVPVARELPARAERQVPFEQPAHDAAPAPDRQLHARLASSARARRGARAPATRRRRRHALATDPRAARARVRHPARAPALAAPLGPRAQRRPPRPTPLVPQLPDRRRNHRRTRRNWFALSITDTCLVTLYDTGTIKTQDDIVKSTRILTGPRFTLLPVRILSGCFRGATLYENPNFVSINTVR